MMVYILLILLIIQAAIFGYILWDLKSDVEFLEDYICCIGDSVSNLETEIKMSKEKDDETGRTFIEDQIIKIIEQEETKEETNGNS